MMLDRRKKLFVLLSSDKRAVQFSALRSIGKRNQRLHTQAIIVAERLAARPEASARWIGKDALSELRKPAQVARVHRK